ncbi:hypothetical protein AQUCO_00901011v1 [Aquilegia coerulea]|uniref:Uncharacterized protein n=1 Tax=Aquilegia coerulea TaxID=218851 RepID=A0A2G5EGG1_AQUCA|nr:hypothetical protein AQUCO_00901011v1 [Aquilegia coerulea]
MISLLLSRLIHRFWILGDYSLDFFFFFWFLWKELVMVLIVLVILCFEDDIMHITLQKRDKRVTLFL